MVTKYFYSLFDGLHFLQKIVAPRSVIFECMSNNNGDYLYTMGHPP